MNGKIGRAVFLTAYLYGLPTEDGFDIRDIAVEPPSEGEMLLRTVWMSVGPYMRGTHAP